MSLKITDKSAVATAAGPSFAFMRWRTASGRQPFVYLEDAPLYSSLLDLQLDEGENFY